MKLRLFQDRNVDAIIIKISSQLFCGNPNTQRDGNRRGPFGKCLDPEIGAAWMRSVLLEKKPPESSLPASARWGYREKTAISEPGSWFSPDPKSGSASVLDLPPPELQEINPYRI